MALQHKERHPYGGPLQTGYTNNQLSSKSLPEKKSNDSDEIMIDSLPLRIFPDGASRFMCEQCRNIPLKAASCNMGHVFCRKCIIALCERNELCPVDKTQITQPTLKNAVLDNMIAKEHISCLYSGVTAMAASENGVYDEGGGVTKGDECDWEGAVAELFTHLKECKFKPTKCPFIDIGCNESSQSAEKKEDQKIVKHYNEYNVMHQNLILNEMRNINDKISAMQKEMEELRSILNSPGGGILEQLTELKRMYENIKVNGIERKEEYKIEGGGQIQEEKKELIDPAKNVLIGAGCNEKGDLGVNTDENIRELQELLWSRGVGIVGVISCSYKAFCFLTGNGDIYVSGCNDFGQLGLNTEEDQLAAKIHPFFTNSNLKIQGVSRSINAFHVLFICAGNNEIYCCGANEYGQLGLDDQENYTTPQLNKYFQKNNVNIKAIACGEYHTLFLSVDGAVYSCGLNESFQLGYKTANEYQKQPKKISNLESEIIQIAAGRDHSYCLDINGNVWSFGSNYRGQLGINNTESSSDQVIINKMVWFENQNKKITQISSGNYHGAAIDKSGNVFVWGRGDEGQIGNNKKSDRFIPTFIDAFNNTQIVNISCGCHHTIALNEENKIFCWGNNRYNQCADDVYVDNYDGQHLFCKKPKEYYQSNQNDKIVATSAGSYHTLLLLNKV